MQETVVNLHFLFFIEIEKNQNNPNWTAYTYALQTQADRHGGTGGATDPSPGITLYVLRRDRK
jgi:hypothetical protein